jgi:hypothetical protein
VFETQGGPCANWSLNLNRGEIDLPTKIFLIPQPPPPTMSDKATNPALEEKRTALERRRRLIEEEARELAAIKEEARELAAIEEEVKRAKEAEREAEEEVKRVAAEKAWRKADKQCQKAKEATRAREEAKKKAEEERKANEAKKAKATMKAKPTPTMTTTPTTTTTPITPAKNTGGEGTSAAANDDKLSPEGWLRRLDRGQDYTNKLLRGLLKGMTALLQVVGDVTSEMEGACTDHHAGQGADHDGLTPD